MRVSVCLTDTNTTTWLAALKQAMPGVEFVEFAPTAAGGQAPMAACEFGIVWAPPQAYFDQQPPLRAVFNIGAGVDALMSRQVPLQTMIVRLNDAGMAVQMAEFVCHAVIRQFRELDAYEAAAKQGDWAYRKPKRREQFTVGILGQGVLGQRVAQALRHFEFPVLGWSRSLKPVDGVVGFAGREGLSSVLSQSQVLVNLLPLTDDTRGLLNRDTLSQLPRGAVLINTARGGHVVESDLLALLDEGHLSAAVLDVFQEEPLPPAHPFWRHPKVVVTPHTSARTLRDQTIAQIAHKIEALVRGEPVAGVVDRQQGY